MSVKEEAFLRNKTESEDYHNLKRDLDALRRDFAKLSSGLIGEAKASAEQVMSGINQKSTQAVQKAEAKITEKPLLSLLLSFVIGLVVAKVLDSRSSR